MAGEILFEVTPVNKGGTTVVPAKVIESLRLTPKAGERCKLLWTLAEGEVVVTKGTPQSDWRKTMLRKNGTAAIPRHIQKALKLKITPSGNDQLLWVSRGGQIFARKRSHRREPPLRFNVESQRARRG